jgi:DNA adenine methylase
VTTYKIIRDDVGQLCAKLTKLSKDVSKEAFERIRSSQPNSEVDIAARFIYLNKTCFNGLWRVNNSGKFNVPWGQLKNPKIIDIDVLHSNSVRLKSAKISNHDFQVQLEKARKGDLVYLDPPYIPISVSSSFSKYSKLDFGISDHERLADTIKELKLKGVFVVLSNSDTPETRRIFGKFMNLYQIKVTRSISANSSSRLKVNEIIATNYTVPRLSQVADLHRLN